MKKFSYALEFYKNEIFSLNNVKLFKYKVKEAETIEKYFLQVIPNPEYIRPYIIRSYKFDKKARGHRRIAYIKGLIFAENYLNLDDLHNFNEFISENLMTEENISLWEYKGYMEDTKNEDEFEGTIQDNTISDLVVKVVAENIMFDDEELEEETGILGESEKLYKALKVADSLDEFDDLDEEFMPIHPKDKIINFKKLKNKYINETIKEKNINNEEKSMVKKGMNDWINYILNSMQDLYNLNEKVLRFNDKNISKYL